MSERECDIANLRVGPLGSRACRSRVRTQARHEAVDSARHQLGWHALQLCDCQPKAPRPTSGPNRCAHAAAELPACTLVHLPAGAPKPAQAAPCGGLTSGHRVLLDCCLPLGRRVAALLSLQPPTPRLLPLRSRSLQPLQRVCGLGRLEEAELYYMIVEGPDEEAVARVGQLQGGTGKGAGVSRERHVHRGACCNKLRALRAQRSGHTRARQLVGSIGPHRDHAWQPRPHHHALQPVRHSRRLPRREQGHHCGVAAVAVAQAGI